MGMFTVTKPIVDVNKKNKMEIVMKWDQGRCVAL